LKPKPEGAPGNPRADEGENDMMTAFEALGRFAEAYCPSDGSPLSWQECNDAYQHALNVLSEGDTTEELKARIAALEAGLGAMHACHRAFSGNENWTALDDEARAEAERLLAPPAPPAPLYRWSVYAGDESATLLDDDVTAATEAEAVAMIPGGVTAEQWMTNHFDCDACEHSWDDEWSCACDDECPICGVDVSPTDSTPLTVEG
jgi:hypothetical protein